MFRALVARSQQAGAAVRGAAPSACAVCRAWPAQRLCATCIARFARDALRCRRCALALAGGASECGECVIAPPPLDRCIAAVGWGWPWSDCIARFKFGREPGWAAALAPLLLRAAGVQELLRDADRLLPLPLAPERLRERGFNQALELARRLAPEKTESAWLVRIRHSPPQASLDRAARLRNVHGAFAVAPGRAADIRGRHLLLIDDVMTTGATMFEAARCVRAAGAARVSAIVLARTDDAPRAGMP